jgi:hypothetical protein
MQENVVYEFRTGSAELVPHLWVAELVPHLWVEEMLSRLEAFAGPHKAA